ncbi:aldehyde dehydrogenase family protein [Streptomyces enissocaesilis]|uniref:Aldehyde dehydrogenase family protein n=1 Tax=Streptomyces enissocaesilis TaxID=332589 RepID=A0ABP6JQH4_9ACTN
MTLPAPAPLVHTFRRGAWQPSLDTVALPGATGTRLALVPEIVAAADRRWWDRTAPGLPPAPAGRRRLLLRALDLFEHGTLTVGGLGPQSGDDFRTALWRTAGLPAPLVDRWCGMLRTTLTQRRTPEPDEALALVSLPGNTFTCLDAVLEQVERSAAVWVRPSRREPLSAARLVAALLAAGWPPVRIAFCPAGQRALGGLIGLTDRHVVFGGTGVAASVRASAALTLRGPGRGCALVPEGMDTAEAVDWLLPLIAADSGRFCSNVRTVVHAGPAAPLAIALAAELDTIGPPPSPGPWPLTAFREPGSAQRAARSVADRMRPGDRLLTRRPPVLEGPGGDTCVTPHLVLVGEGPQGPDRHPLIGHEVPFPFAAVVRATGPAAAAIADGSLFVYRPPSDGTAQRGTP